MKRMYMISYYAQRIIESEFQVIHGCACGIFSNQEDAIEFGVKGALEKAKADVGWTRHDVVADVITDDLIERYIASIGYSDATEVDNGE